MKRNEIQNIERGMRFGDIYAHGQKKTEDLWTLEKKLHHTICEFVDCNNGPGCCNDDVEHVGSIDWFIVKLLIPEDSWSTDTVGW